MGRARRVVPRYEGWLRELTNDRLEIFLKVDRTTPAYKIRSSGPKADMLELVEWFEEKTGLTVSHPILPPRVKKPIPGQMELVLGAPPDNSQLSSAATVA